MDIMSNSIDYELIQEKILTRVSNKIALLCFHVTHILFHPQY